MKHSNTTNASILNYTLIATLVIASVLAILHCPHPSIQAINGTANTCTIDYDCD